MYSALAPLRLLATCLLLSTTATAAAEDQHQKELREHYEHLKAIAQFQCKAPQPRVLSVNHLFAEDQLHGKAYFPDMTVLHRCDEFTGTCVSQHQCRPVHSHAVDLPFKVTFLDDVDHHRRGSWIIEYYTLQNHTECACEVTPPPTPVVTDQFCSDLQTSCSAMVTTCSQLHTSCGLLSLAQKHQDKTVVQPHQLQALVKETTTVSTTTA